MEFYNPAALLSTMATWPMGTTGPVVQCSIFGRGVAGRNGEWDLLRKPERKAARKRERRWEQKKKREERGWGGRKRENGVWRRRQGDGCGEAARVGR